MKHHPNGVLKKPTVLIKHRFLKKQLQIGNYYLEFLKLLFELFDPSVGLRQWFVYFSIFSYKVNTLNK